MSIWTRMVGEKLNSWDGRGHKHQYLNFLAYLHPFASRGVASELNEKFAYKDGRYSSTDVTNGSADALNGISDNNVSWRAYEASLMSRAFDSNDMILEGDLFSIVSAVDNDCSVDEIDGYYDGRNQYQWEGMADSFKRVSKDEEIEYLGVKFVPEINAGKSFVGGFHNE